MSIRADGTGPVPSAGISVVVDCRAKQLEVIRPQTHTGNMKTPGYCTFK